MTARELLEMEPPKDVLVLGTDEAGYGPNLGPLLVGATCWSAPVGSEGNALRNAFAVPSESTKNLEPSPRASNARAKKRRAAPETPLFDLCLPETTPEDADALATTDALVERLNTALAPVSAARGVFPLVDSKRLYAGSKSLDKLERSFFIAAALLNLELDSFQEATRVIATESNPIDAPSWERDAALELPVAQKTKDPDRPIAAALEPVRALFARERLALLALRARRVQPREFNAMLDRPMLKSDLIADVTTATLVETLRDVLRAQANGSQPVYAIALCDKLGGRDRYLAILQSRFPNATIATIQEARAASVYRLVAENARDRNGELFRFQRDVAIEIRFTAKGESNAPTALASIVAKYLRELAMTVFNAFWKRATGNDALVPTAGYPVDAPRFRNDVEATRRALGIRLQDFWRNK